MDDELKGQTTVYDHLPPVARTSDPSTSHEAAATLANRPTMMRRILRAYERTTWTGLTAEEAAHRAGYSAHDGAWKRVSDLKRLGLIEPTGSAVIGSSGRKMAVLRITSEGRKALAHWEVPF